MKKTKKIMSVVLAATMLAGVMTSCGKKSKSEYTEDGRMIITMANSVAVSDNSPVEQYLEKKYNVEIKTYGFGASYYDKLGTMFASKEIPDVMFINDVSNWEPLVSQGVIAPIDLKTIEDAAPNHYKHINETNDKLWEVGTRNGQLYAIPKTMGKEYNTAMIWNKNWFDAVGIEKAPETIEECDVVFDKLVNGDPDGNGKKDTYAISGIGGNYYRQFDWLFGAYGVMPEMWTLRDGKVVNGTVTDEARKGLEKLNEWYKKGYINPEYLTDDQNTIAKRYTQNGIASYNTGIQNVTPLHRSGKANLETMTEAQRNQITYGPLPAGPDGDRGDWLWGPLSNFVCFGAQVKDDVEKQEVILKMLDDLNYNEEVAIMASYGEKGKHWEYNDETVGKASGIKALENYGSDANARAEVGLGFFNLLKCGAWADESIVKNYDDPKYIEEQEKVANWGGYTDLLMRANLPSTLNYATILQSLKTVAYTEFINGKRSLSDWDKFVEEYMAAGGAVLQKEAQEYYDTVINK